MKLENYEEKNINSEKEENIEKVFRYINKENLDLEYSFPLTNEQDIKGEKIPGKSYWLKLSKEDNVAEGKFYLPEQKQDTHSLVVFAPGMPGDASTWFEEKHVNFLLEQGYTVFTARHNGTKLGTETAMRYIHSSERIEKGLEGRQKNIGEQKEYSLRELMAEYKIILNLLHDKFKEIKLVGHSSGVFNLSRSLGEIPFEVSKKIKNFVALSGFIGGYDESQDSFDPEGRFDSESLRQYYEYCREFINLKEAKECVEEVKEMMKEIYSFNLLKDINYIQVNSEKDEYIPLDTAKKFQEHVGGLRIIDKSQFRNDFHDLNNLRPQTLQRLLNIKTNDTRHTAVFKQQEPKKVK